ncbi:MAG: substrate-binding domain-containing protein [Treponema sp.]|jgi:D-xylose transport system substrate-binding protein|nr:substrate-binding domain-containing protein [Treponema sp.]
MKKIFVVILSLVVLFLLSCSPKKDSSSRKNDDKITIGFSVATDTFVIERWNKDVKVFSGAASELGANIVVQLSAGGTKEQIDQINYLIQQNIDILVVIPHDTELIAGVVKQVRDSGIPVVAYDRLVTGVPVDAFISFDNREVGRHFGRALIDAVPSGNYVIVNGAVTDSNSYEVNAGLHEIIDPLVENEQIEVVHEAWLNEWSFDEALEVLAPLFEQNVQIDAISCANDQIAAAAIQLLSERRLAGTVAVVGQDAELINCQRVVEGIQLMSVYKPIGKLAARAAELAVSIVNGEQLMYDTLMNNQSDTMIPSYVEHPIAVFKENMDETVIKDGFHSAEDVYRNVAR